MQQNGEVLVDLWLINGREKVIQGREFTEEDLAPWERIAISAYLNREINLSTDGELLVLRAGKGKN